VLLLSPAAFALGETAVITLVFPPGARATGLAEAFTGVADDINATYYNPAGLGQAPMANSWQFHVMADTVVVTAIDATARKDFGKKDRVWAGTNHGIKRFNGKAWDDYDTYIIEESDDLRSVTERFLDVDDDNLVRRALMLIREINGIDQERSESIRSRLATALPDSARTDERIDDLSLRILSIEPDDNVAARIYGLLTTVIDTAAADSLSDRLAEDFVMEDVGFEDLVELKVPFDIAIDDTVTCVTVDESGRVWAGSHQGLWRYDGSSWIRYSVIDGLPSDRITAVGVGGALGEIAVGTNSGLAVLTEGEWRIWDDENGMPDNHISSVIFNDDILYAGTGNGLARIENGAVTVFDTASGLLSNSVRALLYDSREKLWIGGPGGIAIYDQTSWKRYKFPNSIVSSFAEYEEGKVWIGTDQGAIAYTAGRTRVNDDGVHVEEPPTWKAYHAKNAMRGNRVVDLTVHGKDVWIVTEKAINQYDRADMQFMIAYEPLLPAFNIPDLWHIYSSFVLPTEDWGTFGITFNYLNFGLIDITDPLGRETGTVRSWEGVLYLSYGLPIRTDLSFGLNVKYVHSALAPGIGPGQEGVAQSFAFDAALLKRNLLFDRFDVGFMLQNMGPPVYYIDQNQRDPIPFTARLGLAYTPIQNSLHELMVVMDVDREIAVNDPDEGPHPFWKAIVTDLVTPITDHPDSITTMEAAKVVAREFIGHWGVEYWYAGFLALRTGYMLDLAGSRKELNVGVGVRYGNLSFDWSYIHSPKTGAWLESPARDQQWRASFIFRL
jgi:hypothetical protein